MEILVELSPTNGKLLRMAYKVPLVLIGAITGFQTAFAAVFLKYMGEIIQDNDGHSVIGLMIFLAVTAVGISIITLILTNYLMRDYE